MRDLIEGLCQQIGHVGQADRDLAGHGHQVPKPRHVGPPRGNQNESLYRESSSFSTTLPNMAVGGKAYASRSSHGRVSASTATARESGIGETN